MASDNQKSNGQILSQNEIDELLEGVEKGKIPTENVQDQEQEVQSFQFLSQERLLTKRFPRLEVINDQFAKRFQENLYSTLEKRVSFQFNQIEMVKFKDYVKQLTRPVSLHVAKIEGLEGMALLALEGDAIFGMIERLFGGKGATAYKMEERAFTAMEMKIIDRFLSSAILDLNAVWEGLFSFNLDIIAQESNPELVNIASDLDVMMVNKFNFTIDDCAGEYHLVMSYSMLEPIREILDAKIESEALAINNEWKKMMLQNLSKVPVQLKSNLSETDLNLSKICDLQVGNIIPIELPKQVVLFAEDKPMFVSKFGVSNDKYSLKIIERYRE